MMNVMDCLDKAGGRAQHHIHHDCFGQVKPMVPDDEFRSLMAGVCAPVTVVTTADAGGPAGSTVSAFASLTCPPPLISVSFGRGSSLLGRIQSRGRVGGIILAHG